MITSLYIYSISFLCEIFLKFFVFDLRLMVKIIVIDYDYNYNYSHSVRTGEQGVGDRMSIEHTIGDRTHIIEKQRDRSGRIREKQRFINLDEGKFIRFTLLKRLFCENFFKLIFLKPHLTAFFPLRWFIFYQTYQTYIILCNNNNFIFANLFHFLTI